MLEDLLQPRHLLVILGIALLMFGPRSCLSLKGFGRRHSGLQRFDEESVSDDSLSLIPPKSNSPPDRTHSGPDAGRGRRCLPLVPILRRHA